MLYEGQQVELTIEKPAAGGRMIARHLGQVVLVRGAIPGERVHAWIERAEKHLAFAVTRDVLQPSPDRRAADGDPLCGGALYAHIEYSRQLVIKAEVLRDALTRLGRHPVDFPIDVAGSPEHGYRMRARFHVQGARAGFYREGTHQLCDAAPTRQLLPETIATVQTIVEAVDRAAGGSVTSLAITENLAGVQRAAHLELAPSARIAASLLDRIVADAGLVGLSARAAGGQLLSSGDAVVSDPLTAVTGGRAEFGDLLRHAESFFQGNRYLLADLVQAVLAAVPEGGEVLDLYAGVGLFAVSLAAVGHSEITAVEGDRTSGTDLRRNARAYESRIASHVARVEDYLSSRRGRPAATTIVDPPRTGISKEALDAVIVHGSPRIVYVSCDPATLARDTRRLLDAGYRLISLRAFDLFPNTAHVESLAIFEQAKCEGAEVTEATDLETK
jgi:23S rRNA (uracil1939-C5)-methyltransferase